MDSLHGGQLVWVFSKSWVVLDQHGDSVRVRGKREDSRVRVFHRSLIRLDPSECNAEFSELELRTLDIENYEPSPCLPTKAEPGSKEKIDVLRARLEAGESLWHSADPFIESGVSQTHGFVGFGTSRYHKRASDSCFAIDDTSGKCRYCGSAVSAEAANTVATKTGLVHAKCLARKRQQAITKRKERMKKAEKLRKS